MCRPPLGERGDSSRSEVTDNIVVGACRLLVQVPIGNQSSASGSALIEASRVRIGAIPGAEATGGEDKLKIR